MQARVAELALISTYQHMILMSKAPHNPKACHSLLSLTHIRAAIGGMKGADPDGSKVRRGGDSNYFWGNSSSPGGQSRVAA
jgi:hypothetical protein